MVLTNSITAFFTGYQYHHHTSTTMDNSSLFYIAPWCNSFLVWNSYDWNYRYRCDSEKY